MSLWTWLFGSKEKKGVLEPESLRFVKSLCEQHSPNQHERWALGYLYQFVFNFPDGIKIEVEYNVVRGEWDIEIWSSRSSEFLYYYDCLSPKPRQAINYMINRFDLRKKVDAAVAVKEKKKAKDREITRSIKEKYL